jgi:purine-nucleoside phosphorylase
MTPHIEAKKEDYSEIVLMPGDPLRAKHVSDNFLTNVINVNSVRNCLGFTGYYKGKRVSVQASGMGQPSLGIYAHELFKFYDVQKIIRIGSCGGISPKVNVGDIIVALTASTDSAMSKNLIPGFIISPCCDYQLLRSFMNNCSFAHVGSIVSNDYFYQPNSEWFKPLIDMGILAVDMETHLLYTLSMRYCKSALSVNTVSDHLLGGYEMTSKERENGLNTMIEKVLESI